MSAQGLCFARGLQGRSYKIARQKRRFSFYCCYNLVLRGCANLGLGCGIKI